MAKADVSSSGADAAGMTPKPMVDLNPAEMKRVFDLFDHNKDGFISAEELQQYMNRLGFELSEQRVKDMVKTVDHNEDDCVDFEEFASLYTTLMQEGAETTTPRTRVAKAENEQDEALRQAFSVFDDNNDGLITALELQSVLLKLGLAEGKSLMSCQKMIEKVDADGNGKVDFAEFKQMMRSGSLNL